MSMLSINIRMITSFSSTTTFAWRFGLYRPCRTFSTRARTIRYGRIRNRRIRRRYRIMINKRKRSSCSSSSIPSSSISPLPLTPNIIRYILLPIAKLLFHSTLSSTSSSTLPHYYFHYTYINKLYYSFIIKFITNFLFCLSINFFYIFFYYDFSVFINFCRIRISYSINLNKIS